MIVKIEIEIDDDFTAHSKIVCGDNQDFLSVERGIEVAIQELHFQIENKTKCPFSKTKNS